MDAINLLTMIIMAKGPIPTIRVSTVKEVRGKGYGVARYELKIRKKDGSIVNKSLGAARATHRFYRSAVDVCHDMARKMGRCVLHRVGEISEEDAEKVVAWIKAKGVDQTGGPHDEP